MSSQEQKLHRAAVRIERQCRRRLCYIGKPRVRRTDGRKVQGRSLFTIDPIAEGAHVMHYRGRILRRDEMVGSSRAQRYYLFLDTWRLIDGGTGGPRPQAGHASALINSPAGCICEDGRPVEANCAIRIDPSKGLGQRTVSLKALRDIAAGEELFFDYGEHYDLSELSSDSSDASASQQNEDEDSKEVLD